MQNCWLQRTNINLTDEPDLKSRFTFSRIEQAHARNRIFSLPQINLAMCLELNGNDIYVCWSYFKRQRPYSVERVVRMERTQR